MTKYILGGGRTQKPVDRGRAFCEELVRGIELYRTVKILDCLFAIPMSEWDQKLTEDNEMLTEFITNFELILADPDKFEEQVKEADVVFLRGGETDILLDLLRQIPNWTKNLEGKTIAGSSAGAMAIAKYSHALEQDKFVEGLGLLPVKVIAHWKTDIYEVDWDRALKEIKEYKEDLPVYTLTEGEFVVIKQ